MLKLLAVGVDPTRICPEGLHTEVAQTITIPPQAPTNLQLGRVVGICFLFWKIVLLHFKGVRAGTTGNFLV